MVLKCPCLSVSDSISMTVLMSLIFLTSLDLLRVNGIFWLSSPLLRLALFRPPDVSTASWTVGKGNAPAAEGLSFGVDVLGVLGLFKRNENELDRLAVLLDADLGGLTGPSPLKDSGLELAIALQRHFYHANFTGRYYNVYSAEINKDYICSKKRQESISLVLSA